MFIQQSKLALSPCDDKRYLVPPSNIQTLPWGHYQSSDPEHVFDLVDIEGNPINDPVVNNAPIVNYIEVPLVNNDVDLSDNDADLQETLKILESILELNERERAVEEKRKRKREEEEEDDDDEFDMDVLNAIVDVCSMPMDHE